MLPINQQNVVDTASTVLADIFSQFPGSPEEYTAAITESLATAFAKQTAKATPIQIVNDSLALAGAVSAEIGKPNINKFITDLTTTVKDVEAGSFAAAVVELITDYKDAKAL